MSGSKYCYAVTQIDSQGVLNPDAHMFVQEDFYQTDPDVVAAIMIQLSLKAGLKEWGDEAFTAVKSNMRQLKFRNTFKPKHWLELSQVQRQTVLESHMFLKQKRDGNIKGEPWLVAITSETTSPRRMLARQPSLHNQCCCHESLTPRKNGRSY
jgi:hypothetical protein